MLNTSENEDQPLSFHERVMQFKKNPNDQQLRQYLLEVTAEQFEQLKGSLK